MTAATGERLRSVRGRDIAHTVHDGGTHTMCGYPITPEWTPAAPSLRTCTHCNRRIGVPDADGRDCLALVCAHCPEPIGALQLFVGDNGAPKHHYTCPKDDQ